MLKIIVLAKAVQRSALIALLVFAPLARGGAPRWAFLISVWLTLVATVAMLIRRLWSEDRRILPRTALEIPIVMLMLWAGASIFTSIYPTATGWALLRLLLYLCVFYLGLDAVSSRRWAKTVALTVVGLGAGLAVLGLIKYFGGNLPDFWAQSGSGQERFLTATFFNHNHIAGYLEMALAMGLGLLISGALGRGIIWPFCLFLILVAQVLTMARGGWVSTVVALIFMTVAIFRKKKVRVRNLILVGLAALVLLTLGVIGSSNITERIETLDVVSQPHSEDRVYVWAASLQLIREHPWLGTGLGTFPWSFTKVRPPGLIFRYREAHNDYLDLITQLGLPIIIPLIWGLVLIFGRGLKTFRRARSRFSEGITIGALGGIVAILVHSITDFNIQVTANGIVFSLLVGLAMGVDRLWLETSGDQELTDLDEEIKAIELVDSSGKSVAGRS